MRRLSFVALLAAVMAVPAFAGTGKVIIVNVDSPGVGLNDPAPAVPVGGNLGTTVGQQRLNVFQAAAARWSTMLDTNVDILVESSFAPLECSLDSAVLGSAGPRTLHRDFSSAPKAGTWYPVALAKQIHRQRPVAHPSRHRHAVQRRSRQADLPRHAELVLRFGWQ